MQISDIYEMVQESDLIQKNRSGYEAEIGKFMKEFLTNAGLDEEKIRDELYGLLTKAEKAGFAAGFRCGTILIKDCFS